MQNLSNIERSAFPRGPWKYVGYGHGCVYSVGKPGDLWCAMLKTGNGPKYLSARTLQSLSEKLAGQSC